MRIIIAGAGIGGLTAALALRNAGHEVEVYEKASSLERLRVGGGIHVWTNAMRAFQQIGIADRVIAIGSPLERQQFYSWKGKLLVDWPVGDLTRRLGVPSVGVSRADLQPVLVDALEGDSLHLGTEVTSFTQDASGVTVRFADGSEARGDALVGADGIKSAVRRQLLGESEPRYAGYAVWQAIVDFEHPELPVGHFHTVWGPGTRFVTYHVGGPRLYWVAVINAPAGETDTNRGWLLDRLKGFKAPTAEVIEATDPAGITRADHMDRKPVDRWGKGRVTLLGDAAHPMTFNVGQGACMAIEDAVALSKYLRGDDPTASLRSYEEARIPRTTARVKLAWNMGTMARWHNPVAVTVREQIMQRMFRSIGWKQHCKTLSYEV